MGPLASKGEEPSRPLRRISGGGDFLLLFSQSISVGTRLSSSFKRSLCSTRIPFLSASDSRAIAEEVERDLSRMSRFALGWLLYGMGSSDGPTSPARNVMCRKTSNKPPSCCQTSGRSRWRRARGGGLIGGFTVGILQTPQFPGNLVQELARSGAGGKFNFPIDQLQFCRHTM